MLWCALVSIYTGVILPILVRNLPRSLTEAELNELFLPFGEVLSCDLVMDSESGKSKGFGFVVMAQQESIEKAIAALNGRVINETKIRVKWSNQERQSTAENPIKAEKTVKKAIPKDIWDSAKPKLDDE